MIPFIPPKFNVGPNTHAHEFRGAVLGQLFRVQDASSTAACTLGLSPLKNNYLKMVLMLYIQIQMLPLVRWLVLI